MHGRDGATCCEQYGGEKEKGISRIPCQDDRPYAGRRIRLTGQEYSILLSCNGKKQTSV